MNANALSFVARKSSCCSWIATFPTWPWFWGATAHCQSFCVWSEMYAGPTWFVLTCCCPEIMWRSFYPAAPQSRTNIHVKHREIKVTLVLSCMCAKLSFHLKKMCRDPFPAGDLLTNTHTVVHIQRKLCVKLTICGLVFIFCLVMRAGLWCIRFVYMCAQGASWGVETDMEPSGRK